MTNHFANFWILAKGKNQNKSNRPPRNYFADVDEAEMENALVSRDLLDYSKYRKFIEARSIAMLDRVSRRLSLSNADFAQD